MSHNPPKLVLKLSPTLLRKTLSVEPPSTPFKPTTPSKARSFRELDQAAYLRYLYSHDTRDLVPQQWLTPDGQITSTRKSLDPTKNHEHVQVGSAPFDPWAEPCLASRQLAAQVRTNTAILRFMSQVCSHVEPPANWHWRDVLEPAPEQLEFTFTWSHQ